MATTPEGQRLFIPALAPFYARVTDLSWLLIRLTAGLMLLPHGIPKWQAAAPPSPPGAWRAAASSRHCRSPMR
jgi:hypothetical protein